MFPNSVSTHQYNISSSSEVKLEDSIYDDIYTFLKSQFNIMEVEPGWTIKTLDYLVSHTTSIFIQTTIYYNIRVNIRELDKELYTRLPILYTLD